MTFDLPPISHEELVAFATIVSIATPLFIWLIVSLLSKFFVKRKEWWHNHKNLERQATADRVHANKCFTEHLKLINKLETTMTKSEAVFAESMKNLANSISENQAATKENTEAVQSLSKNIAVIEDRQKRE